VESKSNMAIPPRRWVGYALLASGLSLLFDTLTFLRTNWSPLKVPMYAADELAIGCLFSVVGVLLILAPTLRRLLLRTRIGVALIVIAAAVYGGWEWWMATRTWVPLDMPVSLARGHFRSPEFKINLDAGFWIFVEVETKVDDEGVSCLTGYTSDYCLKNGVRELRASWTLSDRGRVVARGSTDSSQGSRGGMDTKARYLGNFSVPAGDHFVLDVEFPEDNIFFNGGHPRLTIAQSYYWSFDEERTPLFLFATLVGAIGAALLVSGIVENRNRKHAEQTVTLTSPLPIPLLEEGAARGTPSPTAGQDFQYAQRLPLRRPIVGIPQFGLIGGIVFAILAILMMMLTGAFERVPVGLWVHALKPGAIPAKPDAWTVPEIVMVTDAGPGQEPGLSMNSKVVAWDDLASALKHELSGRREWTVYVEGDDCVAWANVVNVIDIAHSDGAKVFLVPQPNGKPCKTYVGTRPPRTVF